jgi:hypothetical protein
MRADDVTQQVRFIASMVQTFGACRHFGVHFDIIHISMT